MKKYIGFFVFVAMMASWTLLNAQQKRDANYFKRELWQVVVSHLEKPAQDSIASKKNEPKKTPAPLSTSKRDTIEQFVTPFVAKLPDFVEYNNEKMKEKLGIRKFELMDGTIVVLRPMDKLFVPLPSQSPATSR